MEIVIDALREALIRKKYISRDVIMRYYEGKVRVDALLYKKLKPTIYEVLDVKCDEKLKKVVLVRKFGNGRIAETDIAICSFDLRVRLEDIATNGYVIVEGFT